MFWASVGSELLHSAGASLFSPNLLSNELQPSFWKMFSPEVMLGVPALIRSSLCKENFLLFISSAATSSEHVIYFYILLAEVFHLCSALLWAWVNPTAFTLISLKSSSSLFVLGSSCEILSSCCYPEFVSRLPSTCNWVQFLQVFVLVVCTHNALRLVHWKETGCFVAEELLKSPVCVLALNFLVLFSSTSLSSLVLISSESLRRIWIMTLIYIKWLWTVKK